VVGHIFQARPVWIYTQSNITNIILNYMFFMPSGEKISKYESDKNVSQNRIL
jgi:hypothetical protein